MRQPSRPDVRSVRLFPRLKPRVVSGTFRNTVRSVCRSNMTQEEEDVEMGLKSADRYAEALNDGRRIVYRGQEVPNVVEHPVLGRAVRHAAVDFQLADHPEYRSLAIVDGDEEPYSRYYFIPQDADDLRRRRDLIAAATRLGGTVVPLIHEIGSDALFGLLHVAATMDRELGTGYQPRVQRFLEEARRQDWALAVAQTDAKGDRRRRPYQQTRPNAYLRIVERRPDGIVVSGMKVHTSVSINAERLLVLPTREMTESDADWAVAFAVPLNAPGLTLVASPYLGNVTNAVEHPLSFSHKMVETMTFFDGVFVPWAEVFMAGEWAWAGPLARAFVEFHRFTAVSYKLPLLTALVGAAGELARLNGIGAARHVREELAQLMIYDMTVRGLLDAAAAGGAMVEPGIFRPDPALTNTAKYHFATGLHQAVERVQDLAGGTLVTAPGAEDLEHPVWGPILADYFTGAEGSGRERLKMLYLAQDLVASELAAYHQVLAIHAEGSIEAEKMTIVQHYPLSAAMEEAQRLAGTVVPS